MLPLSHWKVMRISPTIIPKFQAPLPPGGSRHGFIFWLKGVERRARLKCSLLVRTEILKAGDSVVPGKMQAPSPGLGSYSMVYWDWCHPQSCSSSGEQAGRDRKLGKGWFKRRHNARQMVKDALVRAASATCRAETTDWDLHQFWGSQKTVGEKGCPK